MTDPSSAEDGNLSDQLASFTSPANLLNWKRSILILQMLFLRREWNAKAFRPIKPQKTNHHLHRILKAAKCPQAHLNLHQKSHSLRRRVKILSGLPRLPHGNFSPLPPTPMPHLVMRGHNLPLRALHGLHRDEGSRKQRGSELWWPPS